MTTGKIKCWSCGEEFEYDADDIRPFIYHECKDGKMAAHRYIDLVKKPPFKQKYVPTETVERRQNHLIQEYFNYSFQKPKEEEEEDEDENNQWGF